MKIFKFCILCIVSFLLVTCSKKSDEKRKYFYDFDFFTMQGVGEKDDTYPYVEVIYDSLNKIKEVQFHYKKGYTQKDSILYNKNFIYTESKWQEADEINRYVTVFLPNIIIEYHFYEDIEVDEISSKIITISKKGKNNVINQTVYCFNGNTTLNITDKISELPLSKATIVTKNKIYTKNDILYKESDIINGVSKMTECYQLEGYSYSWWQYIGYLMKTCPGKNVPAPGDW